MRINLNDEVNKEKKEAFAKALAKLAEADPEGKFLDILNGKKLPKLESELTNEDRERIARAQAKRERRAQRGKERD